MHLSKIEIINLWGKENITLEFPEQVTFLTGANGCGKSTLLNVIYDALNYRATGWVNSSKNRFWSAKTYLDQFINTLSLLPTTGMVSAFDNEVDKIVNENFVFHDWAVMKNMETIFSEMNENNIVNHIHYNKQGPSEQKLTICDESHKQQSLAFLFQEDRSNLHNMDKINIDLSSDYWKRYRNSIDERLFYLRDKMQIIESHINKKAADLMLEGGDLNQLQASEDYQNVMKQNNEIKHIISLLDGYFAASGKQVTRDDENKLTLKMIDSDVVIPWHLLSRGEKTLLYLFFAVFLYKSKVTVFLFDEPEISMHVKWQHNLIKDLAELAPDNQFIIATHSPSLVQNGWLGNCLEISAV
jgi:predicted ATPase